MTTYWPPDYVYGSCPSCGAALKAGEPIIVIRGKEVCRRRECIEAAKERREDEKDG